MIFRGTRTEEGCVVTVDGAPLDPRLDLFNHSPTGFEWGYAGSGPAQLSLAILAMLMDDEVAVRLHQKFKFDFISPLSRDEDWELRSDQVHEWLKTKGAEV